MAVIQNDKQISKAASEFGRMGGKAKLAKHGKQAFSEMGKKGMEKRWKDKKKDTNGKDAATETTK